MPKFEKLNLPTEGELITFNKGKPNVPSNPIVPYIRGDGTGVDIWPATQAVLDEAIKKSYGNARKINDLESAKENLNSFLKERPEIKTLEDYEKVAPTIIKDTLLEGLKIAGLK